MTKTEAAEILSTVVVVRARHYGVTHVDVRFYEVVLTEAQGGHYAFAPEGSRVWAAAHVAPAFATVKRAALR